MSAMIGPERLARWVKSRLEKELRNALPDLDLAELSKAGVKAIRLRVMGVAEQAKDLVRRAEKDAAKALREAGENLKGEAEKEAARAFRGGTKGLKKKFDDFW